jgi:hypothetical protein
MKLVLLATNHSFVKFLDEHFDKLRQRIMDSGKTGWAINQYVLIGNRYANDYHLYLTNINDNGEINIGLLSLTIIKNKIVSAFLDVITDEVSNTTTTSMFKHMYTAMLIHKSHTITEIMCVLHIHNSSSSNCDERDEHEELIIDIKMYIINILVDLFIDKYSYKGINIRNNESLQVSKTQ